MWVARRRDVLGAICRENLKLRHSYAMNLGYWDSTETTHERSRRFAEQVFTLISTQIKIHLLLFIYEASISGYVYEKSCLKMLYHKRNGFSNCIPFPAKSGIDLFHR